MVIVEQNITDYISINVVQTGDNWSDTVTYEFEDEAFDEHYYYKSVIDGNIGLKPSDNPNEWLIWRISNRYAQIDLRASTRTTWSVDLATVPADNALITEFANNSYDFLGLGAIEGDNITVEAYDAQGVLQYSSNDIVYDRPNSNNWYGYYFYEFREEGKGQSFIHTLPPIVGGFIRVTIEANDNGLASAGYMVAGYQEWVGDSLFGVNRGLEDNSIVEKDDYGITTITPRTANETMDLDTIFPSSHIMPITRIAKDTLGKIVLFVGDESKDTPYEGLTILGYLESYNSILSNPTRTIASWSVKEVI